MESDSVLYGLLGRIHLLMRRAANRIIDITPDGVVDRLSTYDDFLANETVRQQLQEKYKK